MPAIAPITDANPTVEEMEARVARFAGLRPTDAYVDAGIPGCERTTWRVSRYRSTEGGRPQPGFIPAAFTTFAHLSISDRR